MPEKAAFEKNKGRRQPAFFHRNKGVIGDFTAGIRLF
jgi:hypothetical protein